MTKRYIGVTPGQLNTELAKWINLNLNETLILVDLSIHENTLNTLLTWPGIFIVIDHHNTTVNTLRSGIPTSDRYLIVCDENHCGAYLTYKTLLLQLGPGVREFMSNHFNFAPIIITDELEYFKQHSPLILYVQDRDLFIETMPETESVAAWLNENYSSRLLTNEESEVYGTLPNPLGPLSCVDFNKYLPIFSDQTEIIAKAMYEGKIIVDLDRHNCLKIARFAAIQTDSHGRTVYMCNSPYSVSNLSKILYSRKNNVGEYLCDYVLIWRYDHNTKLYYLSFRSRKTGINVSTIAAEYGGGGHVNAAGAEVTTFDLAYMP